MMNRVELNNEFLEQVNGATFTSNMFTEAEYHKYNIKTDFHFFARDDFQLPTGEWVHEDNANEYIKQVDPEFYRKRFNEIMDAIEHYGA